MNNPQKIENILKIAAGILILSIVLMIVIIPGVLGDTTPGANPSSAVLGISLAIIFRLLLFFGYLKVNRDAKHNLGKRKAEYLVIGILLLVFGFIYMDGAFAFLDHKDIMYVSFLMFGSVLCDLVAGTLTIIAYILNPKKVHIKEKDS
jgi:hypothetical protein